MSEGETLSVLWSFVVGGWVVWLIPALGAVLVLRSVSGGVRIGVLVAALAGSAALLFVIPQGNAHNPLNLLGALALFGVAVGAIVSELLRMARVSFGKVVRHG